MIGAFRRVSLRHFASHKLRTGITIFGISLGVATMIGTRLLLDSANASYQRMVDRIAGRADLQVVNGDAGVPDELLEEVKKVEGVASAAATVQGFVGLPQFPGDFLFLFGIDLMGDQDFRDYDAITVADHAGDPLAFLAEPDSVALTTKFLERTGQKLGESITVFTGKGPANLTIRRALAVRSGPATLLDGRFALMDIYAAQSLFQMDRRFTQIDVRLSQGSDIATVESALAKAVAGRGSVERPEDRGKILEKLLSGNRTVMTLAAASAQIVGLYLVFNTMMIAVVQRRREFGILRSLGMSRGDVLRLILMESLVLGILGCAAGVPFGAALAHVLSPLQSGNLFRVYYLGFDVPDVSFRLGPAAWGVGIGMLSTVLAALLPARDAVTVPPVEASRPTALFETRPHPYWKQAVVGVFLVAFAIGLWLRWDAVPLHANLTGTLILFGQGIGLALLAPALVFLFISRSEPPLRGLFGFTGALASRSLMRNMRRVAITASAFLVSVGGAVSTGTFAASSQYTAQQAVESWFSTLDLAIFAFPPVPNSVVEEMASLPEVSGIGLVRSTKISFEGSLVTFAARGMKTPDLEIHKRRLEKMLMIEGGGRAAIEAFVRGEGVLVNEAFENRFGRHPGDMLRLPTPSGEARLPILARYFDTSFANLGVILIDFSLYERLWNDNTVNLIEPILNPGASVERFTAIVRGNWALRYPMRLFTLDEYRREANAILASGNVVPYALMTIAFAISLLGIVNSVFASVLDQLREIGVLRAVGATRGQIARSIVTESGMIGLAGGLLAAAAGSLFGYLDLDVIFHHMWGVTVFYRYPTFVILSGCLSGLFFAALAGYLPARAATRLKPTEALQYE